MPASDDIMPPASVDVENGRHVPPMHVLPMEHCGPDVQHDWPLSPHAPPTMPASDDIMPPASVDIEPARHTPLMHVLPMEHCGPDVQHA